MPTTSRQLIRTATAWFACLLALSGIVVIVLAATGTFLSMLSFPLIFAFTVLGLAIVTWLAAGSGLNCKVLVPLGLAVLLTFGAHFVNAWVGERRTGGMQEKALAMLSGTPAAELSYMTTLQNGQPVAEANSTAEFSFAGRISVLNFWATWCGPCREELPMLQRFYEVHKAEPVQILGITKIWGQIPDDSALSEGVAQIQEFTTQSGITYPVFVDTTEQNFKAFLVKQIPATILIDSSGRVVDYAIGIEGTKRILGKAEQLLARGRGVASE